MNWRFLRALVAGLLLVAGAVVAPAAAQAAAPTRVMALGDSITGSPGCWRALLWKHLQDTGHTDVDFVGTLPAQGCGFTYDGENEGHGGFLATGIARDNQLPGWLSATHPDIVLMHLGTNDVWNNIPASTVLDAYTTLLGQMRAANPATKLIVAKIIPMNPSNCAACGQRVVDLNNAIPGWAQAHSTAASPITVVDQWTGFDTAADTGDGVHPNNTTGIQKIESRWYPALVAALGPDTPAATGLHVDGTRILEGNGSPFVMRGVNHAYVWYPGQNRAFADIKSFGANTVRVVLGSGQRWGPTPAAEVTSVVGLCKQNRLICVLEAHDTTGYGEQSGAATLDQAAGYWISVASALKGQENYVVINLGNEPFGNDQQVSATWTTATSNAIKRLRAAGLQHLLMADAPMWGQDWQNIMRDNAGTVFTADPQHNTVFSIHMYGVYDTAAEINAYFDAFRTAGLPLVVGEFGNMHSDGNPDEDTIMAQAQARGLGYLGWSWSGNSSDVGYLDMTNNFDPGSLTAWGERFLNGANGIRQTSKEATIFGGGQADTQAPSVPGTPAVSGVTSSGATLSWAASTDNVGVAGYDVLRAPGASGGTFAVVGSAATTSYTDSGLAASSTYRYQVRARDAAGNTSAASGIATATTSAGGGTGACKVAYAASNWGGGGGFTANVTITNTGTSAVNGWTLAFTFAGGQQVTLPGWGATFAQSGGGVTAKNLSWNGSLAPNASTGVGFNGTHNGSNPAPTAFTLNGSTCSAAATPVPAPAVAVEKALPAQCSGTAPIKCHFAVAPGNYDVTAGLGSSSKAANTSMSVEARRQVLNAVSTNAGQVVPTTVTVNVRNPEGQPTGQGGTGTQGLDITFGGSAPAITSLTVTAAAAPLVTYLAGDSTVCDQPVAPYTGWGQILPAAVRNGAVVANYGDSGESSGSFLSNSKLFPTMKPLIKSRDLVLIQFGHNDKQTSATAFRNNLTKLVNGVRERGGVPVLVTPPVRRQFNGTKLTPTALHVNGVGADLPAVIRALGKSANVPVIDLTAKSKALVESLGPSASQKIYLTQATDGVTDNTHFSVYGATQMSNLVVQGVRELNLTLVAYLR